MGRRSRERIRRPKEQRRTARPKLRKVDAAVADLRERLDHRDCELEDALQQQIATSEVLRVSSVSLRLMPNPRPPRCERSGRFSCCNLFK
jgi:hypothetical protein